MTEAPDRRAASRRREDHERDRLFDLTQDMLAVCDLAGRFRQCNPSWERTLGWPLGELTGRPIADFVHLDEAGPVRAALDRLKGGSGTLSIEARFQGKDDRSHWFQFSATADAANDSLYVVARDIMGKKLAEAESARFAAVVKSSSDAIISANLTGTIESWNPAAERLFGYKASEALGKPLAMLSPRASTQGRASQTIDPRILAEPVTNEQAQRRRKDGMLVTVALTVSPVKDVSGAVVATSVIAREVAREG
ncbi:MAG: PAS domain-containing protein [Gemmatimonadales bacterium]